MYRMFAALFLVFANATASSATQPNVSATAGCRIVMMESHRCGNVSTSIPGDEIEASLALHETYQNPQFPYGDMGHTSLALAQARANYGNLGVYTLGNTIAYANGMGGGTSAYAEATAQYQDVIRVAPAIGSSSSPVDVTLGISINRDVSTRSLSTSGYYGTTASLDARLTVTLMDADMRPIQTLLSFQAVACAPIPCASGTAIDPYGIDSFEWTFRLRQGDYLALQGYLHAESDGVFSSVVLGNHNGVGTGTVQSYNSAHTFIRVNGPDSQLVSMSGASYLTSAVPEPAAVILMVGGLLLIVGRGQGSFRGERRRVDLRPS